MKAEQMQSGAATGDDLRTPVKLSVVIPCYNEEFTLKKCVEKVLEIEDETLSLEVLIVDDCSQDRSLEIAHELVKAHSGISVLQHEKNQGKGAALRTGFNAVNGDFVAVQDADLEYDPNDLKRLLVPLVEGKADVVLGSRFLSHGAHRVLYFWHSMGNKLLTFLSNMLTDLNLTDMETCYKMFKTEVIKQIQIEEDRFGFEPEIIAKVAGLRLRVYEMGISYSGRTYEEGKKIGVKDGFRALYCIFRYNASRAPLPVQFVIYLGIGGTAALANLILFTWLLAAGAGVSVAAPIAFISAAILNYLLCLLLLFKHRARWSTMGEIVVYWCVVGVACVIDLFATKFFLLVGLGAVIAKLCASGLGLIFNFLGRRFFVFPETSLGEWRPQEKTGLEN